MLALHSVLGMPAYALTELWICFGFKYARILNMAGSEYTRVIQGSKYDTIWLKMSEWGVYMTEHVWFYNNRQSFEYVPYNT